MKFENTKMLKKYMIKLLVRVAVFLSVLYMYIKDKSQIITLLTQPLYMGLNFMHILWAGFMGMMLAHLFPKESKTMALLKRKEKRYDAVENYSRIDLLEYVQDRNIKAWRVMLVWLVGNGIIGSLYVMNVLDTADMVMLSVFYFLCDYICILFYCPFQSHIMQNKCCVNCRIYDWGHFMMFTPMVFIHNFYALSLFFTGGVVLIHWELVYARHPERFYEGSNKQLKCANCTDKTCQIKKSILK